jgi:hypothetical protein
VIGQFHHRMTSHGLFRSACFAEAHDGIVLWELLSVNNRLAFWLPSFPTWIDHF